MPVRRVLRAMLLASLAALVLSTHVFTSADLIRAKVAETPRQAGAGTVTVTTGAFPRIDRLHPPFAVIARLNHLPPGTSPFSIAIDGSLVCAPRVDGGSARRVDCSAASELTPGIEHEVTITGPPTEWTLDYLELATHHGNTSGANYLVIFPLGSRHYNQPGPALTAAVWLLLTTFLLLFPPRPQPRWMRAFYRLVCGAVVLVMTASFVSQWLSDYRVMIAGWSFAFWIALLLAPRLWSLTIRLAEEERRFRTRWLPAAERLGLLALAPRFVAAVIVVTVTSVGILTGTFIVNGSDSYGYVSEAHLLSTGTFRVEQPFVRDVTWPFARESFAPLGYRPAREGDAIVPTYSPGLPMVMAGFEWLAGRDAVFYVVPMLGGLAVWATYLMGRRLGGPWIGVGAALLVATSPPFLIQLMAPMSDVPAMAWWALCLACVVSERRAMVLIAGLAAGAAILTRPNLVPLAVVPGALLLWRAARERRVSGLATQRLALFASGIISACLVIAFINWRLWGSPLVSAYGSLADQFAWNNLAPNLARYPIWTFQTQTPAVLLAPLAVFLVMPREGDRHVGPRAFAIMLLAFVVSVYASYLFYSPYDGWGWLRFVLPAFPPLLVLTVVALASLLARTPRGVPATVAAVVFLAWYGWTFDQGIFHIKEMRPANVALGEYIGRQLPERAVFLSMQQSGSIRYYSGRLTVRWDMMPPEQIETALEDLRRLGYVPYLVLEDWEEPMFQKRFRGHSALADLDWTPLASHDHGLKVRIYDPADKLAPAASPRTASDLIE